MIRFFAKQPVLVNMLFLGILIVGVLYDRANTKEQMPEVPINAAWISTVYPGVSASDIEKLITIPIEDEIRNVEGIDYTSSSSKESSSFIWVEFKSEIESVTKAVLDLQTAVNQVTDLPADIEKPRVAQAKVRYPAITVVISANDQVREHVLHDIAQTIQDKIEDLQDVGEVRVSGTRERQIEVIVDPDRLKAQGIILPQVIAALKTRVRDVPAGNIKTENIEYALRAIAELKTLDDIRGIVVLADPSGNHVTIGDLAQVKDTFEDATTAARVDGKPGVTLNVLKEYGGDILRLSKQIHKLTEDIRGSLPSGVSIKLIGDGSVEVESALTTLYSNGLLGMVLVLLVLWIFLGARNAILAALGIPVALLGAAIVMYLMGITVSSVALFALILCVGIVVDDAIVILENVYRHLEKGKPALQAALDGTHEVMWPVISSVLTTMAAFLPLLMMTGIMGKFFSIIPKVVVAALAASLLEALFI
ncbi:MAG: efflux RND transporter permease subunit, partial [Pseudomonadota bacterium]